MADSYKITGQKQNVQISPAGAGFENVWDITYKVTSGPAANTVGTVTVLDADHNAKYVQQAIEEKIATLAAVASLGGK